MLVGNTLFIHIPRTAGTYIEELICESYGIQILWPYPDTGVFFGLMKFSENNYFVLQHLTYTEAVNFIGDISAFSIIRNPYDRAVSLFHYWGGLKKFGTFEKFLSNLEKMHLNDYEHRGIQTKNPDFNYLNMCDNLWDCRYHFIPQYKYICEDETVKCKLFKIEEIGKISEILDIEPSFTKPSRQLSFLNESCRSQIYEIYRKDFEILKYSTNLDEDSEF